MRLSRVLAVAAGLCALVAQASSAQHDRQFKDAWFWGLKTGALFYTSQSTSSGVAPLVGGEWLITRTSGGLYVSLDQAFFTTSGGFADRDPDSTSTFTRKVNLHNLRRFNIAAMAFPLQSANLHPYFGLGLSFNEVASATLVVPIANATRAAAAQQTVTSGKAAFSPVFIGGAQYRYNPFSVFGQVLVSPVQQSFFLTAPNTSRPFNASVEVGIRWNLGTSIDGGRQQ